MTFSVPLRSDASTILFTNLTADVVQPLKFPLRDVASVFMKARIVGKLTFEDFSLLPGFTLVHYVTLVDKLSNAGVVGADTDTSFFTTIKTAVVKTARGVQILIANTETGKVVAHNVKVDQQGSTYCILTSVMESGGHDRGLVNVRELVDTIGEDLDGAAENLGITRYLTDKMME